VVNPAKRPTDGTAIRAYAQIRVRAASTSPKPLPRYIAPRKAAVAGTLMVHAKYRSVWSLSPNWSVPMTATKPTAVASRPWVSRCVDRIEPTGSAISSLLSVSRDRRPTVACDDWRGGHGCFPLSGIINRAGVNLRAELHRAGCSEGS
jgi:hypothetical protein